MLGVEPGRVFVDQVGLNHLTWIRAVLLDGRDILGDLLAEHGDELAEHIELPRSVLDDLGAIPSYYLHYFYAHDRELAAQQTGVPRAQTVAEIERELLRMYRDPSLTEKPALLDQRGGAYYSEAAVGVGRVARLGRRRRARRRHAKRRHARRSRYGRRGRSPGADRHIRTVPLPQAPLAPELLGLVQHVTAYERLTVEAATTRDPVVARKALLAHPLIGQVEMVDALLESLVEEAVG